MRFNKVAVRYFLFSLCLWLAGTVGVQADQGRDVRRLMTLLDTRELVQVMRQEGLIFGAELGHDMLPQGGGAPWAARVSNLYDTQKMHALVSAEFQAGLAQVDVAPLIAFYQSPLGRQIVAGELAARVAFLDGATEEAARDRIARLETKGDPRLAAIRRYVGANELVEYNVVGAMNASYRFYQGLVQGGLLDMSEDQILAESWATESETRADTREWLDAYLNAAYSELTLPELKRYIAFSTTPEGQALNRVLFTSFDRMYAELSLGLGLAIADVGLGEDL